MHSTKVSNTLYICIGRHEDPLAGGSGESAVKNFACEQQKTDLAMIMDELPTADPGYLDDIVQKCEGI